MKRPSSRYLRNLPVPLLALSLLISCGGAQKSGGGDVSRTVSAATQLRFDYSTVQVGDSVLFKAEGPRTRGHYKYSAVLQLGTDLWIEQKSPPQSPTDLPIIFRTLLDRTGKVREMWVGQQGGQAFKMWPNPDRAPTVKQPGAVPEPRVIETKPSKTEVAGRVYDATQVTSVLPQPQGKPLVIVDWCSPEVPFPLKYGDKSYGGLLRRVVGEHILELVSVSRDARAELEIPE